MTKPNAVVLAIVDAHGDAALLNEALRDSGAAVDCVVARSANDAQRYVHRQEPYGDAPWPPSLVLLDASLPLAYRSEVHGAVLQHRLIAGVPIVMLMDSHDRCRAAGCREIGAAECLQKPVSLRGFDELARRLLRHLDQAPSEGPSPP